LAAAWRAGSCPAPARMTWPRITYSTCSPVSPARASAALIANPVGVKIGPNIDPREAVELVERLDPNRVAGTVTRICALGVSVALDDFGTGYSSLGYLQRFPVDGLKIDKTFVDALGESHDEQVLLEAIVGIGRTLQLTVVAEGIESAEQWAALQAMGCGLGQGYLFARPMPHDDFVSYAWTALAVV